VVGEQAAVSAADPDRRKAIVTRWVEGVINRGDFAVAEELCTPEAARHTREWVGSFRGSFPDVRMETVQLVAEGDVVVGRFTCSATHLGVWLDHPPTGRRFESVDEVYFFLFSGDRITSYWGLEDTFSRLRQLELAPEPSTDRRQ
jgi:predicted ester cyclase